MLNFSGGEFFVILFVALLLIGPDRLPQFAGQLGRLVRTLKEMMAGAKTTLKEELGDDYAELQKFDPRQYDPRRIVREALLDDIVPSTKRAPSAGARPPASSPPGAGVGGAGVTGAAAGGAAGATSGGGAATGIGAAAVGAAAVGMAAAGVGQAQGTAVPSADPVDGEPVAVAAMANAPFDDEAT